MAFGHGKNTKVYVNGYNMSTFFSSIDCPLSVDTVDTSVFGVSAKTYLQGRRDATLTVDGFWDSSTNASDQVLKDITASTSSVIWTWYPLGDTTGYAGYGISAIETNYGIMGTVDDAVKVTASAISNVGCERITCLHTMELENSSGDSDSLDNSAASTYGGAGYLQVTGTTGTITCYIQHSASGATWDDLITFSGSAARDKQRVTATGTVKQYIQAAWAFSSAGSEATFNIGFCRYTG